MYRRISLKVTVILTVIGIALFQLPSFLVTVLIGLFGSRVVEGLNVRSFITLSSWAGILVYAVVTYFVVAWALRSVGGKVKRDRLTAQDALDTLDEDEIEALKRLLIPPSQRAS